MSLLLYSRCPKPVQLSGLGTGTRLSHAQTSQIADSNKYLARLIISQLEQVVTQCEMLYYFSWFMAGLFTQQSVYSYISNCIWNYKPSGVS